MYGIQETTELLEGLKLVLLAGKKITADGKVNLNDLAEVLSVLKKVEELTKAANGIQEIPKELKDLSLEETQAIVAKVFEIVKEVKAV